MKCEHCKREAEQLNLITDKWTCIACGTYNNKDLIDVTGKNRPFKTSEPVFTKHDTGKPMVSLVEPEFILGVAEVLTMGAKKYAIDNWKLMTDEDIRRVKDSLLRHTLAYTSGELIDKESGLSHLYHAGCNLMFLDYHSRQKT